MKKSDYRNTSSCKTLKDIKHDKEKLLCKIKAEHPKADIENAYNKLDGSNKLYDNYRKEFYTIYNNKCAYCGVSTQVISHDLYQIDHFVCQSKNKKDKEINCITNLVLSCSKCNQKKRDFQIKDEYRQILHPDKAEINNVFLRDDKYYIVISDKYKTDNVVKEFYDKLKLGSQIKRLDFLLMNMQDLLKEIKDGNDYNILNKAINGLQQKRNNFW
jgi:5-methylcytosine-specific restriction endonuclease McrA